MVANALRQLSYPYAMVVVATGTPRLATLAPLLEAPANLICSLALVRTMGAAGVAVGTVIGAVIGLATHILVSMPRTRFAIDVNRGRLALQGWLRPALCIVPSLLVLPVWQRRSMLPLSPPLLALWAVASVGIAWYWGLTPPERDTALRHLRAAAMRPRNAPAQS